MPLRQRALDDDLLHVARAFVDLAHAHVAVDAFDREVAHHAVAAQRLDGGAADFFGHFAGKQLGHGGFFQAGAACIAQRGGMPDELACGFELRGAVGQPETHGLVVEDGGAKALALFGVGQCTSNALRAMPTLCAAIPMRPPSKPPSAMP